MIDSLRKSIRETHVHDGFLEQAASQLGAHVISDRTLYTLAEIPGFLDGEREEVIYLRGLCGDEIGGGCFLVVRPSEIHALRGPGPGTESEVWSEGAFEDPQLGCDLLEPP